VYNDVVVDVVNTTQGYFKDLDKGGSGNMHTMLALLFRQLAHKTQLVFVTT
jgi:hypothetical protein